MKRKTINGKPIVDATKEVVLHITNADVRKGRTKRPNSCAAAQACMRQMGAKQAYVFVSRVYVDDGKKMIRFKAPLRLRDEIISFDRGHKFETGDYTLVPLHPTQRLGRTFVPKKGAKLYPQRGTRSSPAVVPGIRQRATVGQFA